VIRKNKVKDMLKRGEVPVGAIVIMPDPTMAEILGYCGFDFLMFDGEHGVLNPAILEHLVRACDSAGVVAMARLRVDTPQAMLPYLDTGILGVMLPHTKSAADAAWLVEGTKYAPIGKRGVGSGRASAYGSVGTTEHVREWNEEFLAIAQLEDVEAIHALPEILKVEGLDVCHVAANDLSNSMGFTGQPDHPDVREAQAKVVKQIRAGGKWVEMATRPPYNPFEARRLVDVGANMIFFNANGFLSMFTKELVKGTRAALSA
jgi:4-hydroxy-2-oxoheptanedioate aldolase